MPLPRALVPLFALACLALPLLAQPTEEESFFWLGPDGEPLPFQSHEEVLGFLTKAKVLEKEELFAGTNRPYKILLEKDGVRAHAIFRTVDIRRDRVKIDGKTHVDFHDSARYECAAYVISRHLRMNHVPPCVRRSLNRTDGTVQLWVEKAMTQLERREKDLPLPSSILLARDRQTMRLFDALIANIDRNQGNLMIDAKNRLWFIDHTRSFGVDTRVEDLSRLVWCDREVWEGLQKLHKKDLYKSLGKYVDGRRILALLERRNLLVAHFQDRIDSIGEGAVLFDEATSLDDLSDLELATAEEELPRNTSLPLIDG